MEAASSTSNTKLGSGISITNTMLIAVTGSSSTRSFPLNRPLLACCTTSLTCHLQILVNPSHPALSLAPLLPHRLSMTLLPPSLDHLLSIQIGPESPPLWHIARMESIAPAPPSDKDFAPAEGFSINGIPNHLASSRISAASRSRPFANTVGACIVLEAELQSHRIMCRICNYNAGPAHIRLDSALTHRHLYLPHAHLNLRIPIASRISSFISCLVILSRSFQLLHSMA